MTQQYGTYEPPPDIPKRRTPWFTKLLFAFALLMVILVIYGFMRAQPSSLPAQGKLWQGSELLPRARSVAAFAYAQAAPARTSEPGC